MAEINRRGLAATDWRIQRLTRDPELRLRGGHAGRTDDIGMAAPGATGN